MFIGSQSPQRAILASNISTQPVYMLDPRARTATRIAIQYAFMTVGHANDMIMPISNTCFIGFVPPQEMNRTLERNGQAKLVIEEEPARPEGDSGRSSEGNALQDTIPAGIWSRRRDVHLTYERWVSPELQLEVSGRTEDSEGEVVERRLTNISRAEPLAGLFELPAGYRVTEAMAGPDTQWLQRSRNEAFLMVRSTPAPSIAARMRAVSALASSYPFRALPG